MTASISESPVGDFSVASTTGTFTLSQQPTDLTVLFFYPRDNTPGCTQECIDFNALYPQFQEKAISVVGISRDSLASHEKFQKKQGLILPLLADTDESICNLFAVLKEKNMYGKKVMGIERSTFILDRSGNILHAWRKVKVPGHAELVLEAIATLQAA